MDNFDDLYKLDDNFDEYDMLNCKFGDLVELNDQLKAELNCKFYELDKLKDEFDELMG